MRGLIDRLSNAEFGYSLRIEELNECYRLWMTYVHNHKCWNVILFEFAREPNWEVCLLEFLARMYTGATNVSSPVGIHATCAPTILDVLGTDLRGHTSVRIPMFNRVWFEKVIRSIFLQTFKGHEPFALVEFLLIRLKTALDCEWINTCPVLRKVG